MKNSTLSTLLLVFSSFILFVQCEQNDFSSIESQKEEIINEFLDLSLNNNLLYDLYDTQELTILECEKIIQELNTGRELEVILPNYLSDEVNLQQVYGYFYKTARLTQELRRYQVTKDELMEKSQYYPIVRFNREVDGKESILTRSRFSTLNNVEYKRCVRYAEDDYEDCHDQAKENGWLTWTGFTVGGAAATWYTGGIAGLVVGGIFVGPVMGLATYGSNESYCKQTLEIELIRCEEKYK